MASASQENSGSFRCFSGEREDAQEYRRWKTWVQNKILTMEKLPKAARGPFVFTLLSGKALECVEHLDPASYQKEGGEEVLLTLLDQRFPEKDKTDELGELLTEVFAVKANHQETVKGWIGRGSELFDRLKRKTQVDLPEEARGWLLLHRCGLTEEQRAVVLARARVSLKRDWQSASKLLSRHAAFDAQACDGCPSRGGPGEPSPGRVGLRAGVQ